MNKLLNVLSGNVFMIKLSIPDLVILIALDSGSVMAWGLFEAERPRQELHVARISLIRKAALCHPEDPVQDLYFFQILVFRAKAAAKFYVEGALHASLITVEAPLGAKSRKVVAVDDKCNAPLSAQNAASVWEP